MEGRGLHSEKLYCLKCILQGGGSQVLVLKGRYAGSSHFLVLKNILSEYLFSLCRQYQYKPQDELG
jgi:hypothetical protein